MTDLIYTPRSYRGFVKKFFRAATDFDSMLGKTKEIVNAHVTLRNPLDRVVMDDVRKANPAFAIAEFVQIANGDNSLDFITKFNKSYTKYSNDGKTIAGSYGSANKTDMGTQLDEVVNTLDNDQNSRRAVIAIYQPLDTFGESNPNTPCTLSLQFLIRDGKLNCVTTMRSNDIVWGLTYDAFVFTMMQEYVLRQLQRRGHWLELGEYYHNAASLHVYERHYDYVDTLSKTRWPYLMEEMPEEFYDMEIINLFFCIKNVDDDKSFKYVYESLKTQYAKNLANTCRAWYKRNSNPKQAAAIRKSITDPTLKRWLKPWME